MDPADAGVQGTATPCAGGYEESVCSGMIELHHLMIYLTERITSRKNPSMGNVRTRQPPPRWGADLLSAFIDNALANIFATFVHKPIQYKYILDVDSCFYKAASNLSNPTDFVAAFLLLRSHSAYRAACRLALSGQAAESYVVLRSCLEYAIYALHINKNSPLAELWLQRHADDASLRAMRNEFQHAKVIRTLQRTDAKLCDSIALLYERTIDFGGHPNERAVTGSMEINSGGNSKEYLQIYLHSDGLALEHALKTTAQCGLGSLLVFQCIYPERFALLGINEKLYRLRQKI
jgi:hypothetical protein